MAGCALTVLGSAVAAAVVLSFPLAGSHLGSDSILFVGVAENYAAGRGLTIPYAQPHGPLDPVTAARFDGAVPLVQWPPLFPLVLGIAAQRWDAVAAGRAVNGLCFGTSLLLLALLFRRLAHGAWLPALAVAGIVALGPPASEAGYPTRGNIWLALHTSLTTEPLFLTAILAGLLALSVHLETGRALPAALAALAAALACLARYPGVALAGTAVLALLLWPAGHVRRRIGVAVGVAALAVAPLALWLVTLHVQHGPLSPRPAALHGVVPRQVASALATIGGWSAPLHGAAKPVRTLVGILVAAVAALLVVAFARSRDRSASSTAVVIGSFVVSYLAAVLCVMLFFDSGIGLDPRILSPLRPLLVALVVAGAHRALVAATGATYASLATLALAVALLGAAWPGVRAAYRYRAQIRPETAMDRTLRVGLRDVESLPADTLIVTNLPHRIYRVLRRSSVHLPVRRKHHTGRANSALAAELAGLRRLVRGRPSVVVFFETAGSLTLLARGEVEHALGLEPAATCAPLVVYRVPQEPEVSVAAAPVR